VSWVRAHVGQIIAGTIATVIAGWLLLRLFGIGAPAVIVGTKTVTVGTKTGTNPFPLRRHTGLLMERHLPNHPGLSTAYGLKVSYVNVKRATADQPASVAFTLATPSGLRATYHNRLVGAKITLGNYEVRVEDINDHQFGGWFILDVRQIGGTPLPSCYPDC